MSDERALTVKELAEILSVHSSTIYSYAQAGEIPSFRIGNRWRFYLSEVREHLGRASDPWALPGRVERTLRRR